MDSNDPTEGPVGGFPRPPELRTLGCQPGFVVKTKRSHNSKVFINIYSHDSVTENYFRPLTMCEDSKGEICRRYEVVLPKFRLIECSTSEQSRNEVAQRIIESLNQIFADQLAAEFTIPKVRKGFVGDDMSWDFVSESYYLGGDSLTQQPQEEGPNPQSIDKSMKLQSQDNLENERVEVKQRADSNVELNSLSSQNTELSQQQSARPHEKPQISQASEVDQVEASAKIQAVETHQSTSTRKSEALKPTTPSASPKGAQQTDEPNVPASVSASKVAESFPPVDSVTMSHFLVEAFENQRRANGWSGDNLMTHPKFCDEQGNDLKYWSIAEAKPPTGHAWVNEWAIDRTYTHQDAEGWSYAISYEFLNLNARNNQSVSSPSLLQNSRRRKWVRTACPAEDLKHVQEKTSPAGAVPAADAPTLTAMGASTPPPTLAAASVSSSPSGESAATTWTPAEGPAAASTKSSVPAPAPGAAHTPAPSLAPADKPALAPNPNPTPTPTPSPSATPAPGPSPSPGPAATPAPVASPSPSASANSSASLTHSSSSESIASTTASTAPATAGAAENEVAAPLVASVEASLATSSAAAASESPAAPAGASPAAPKVAQAKSTAFDPTTSCPPVQKGYLEKQGQVIKNWRKRYLVIDAGTIRYYEKPTDSPPWGQGLKGELSLSGYTPNLQSSDRIIRLTSDASGENRELLLRFDGMESLQQWWRAFNNHIAYAARIKRQTTVERNSDMMFRDSDTSSVSPSGPSTKRRSSVTSAAALPPPESAGTATVDVPDVIEGELKKQGHGFASWKTRFTVLDKGILRYYESELPHYPYGKNLKGEMKLTGYSAVPKGGRRVYLAPMKAASCWRPRRR